ncbi:phospholipase D-like domain-containing anti-phage protein [Methylorubrum thiocyanatum]|uniref:phospholipase D-like domain-containing anti-phage protein n=1 Tax=Methylorubrum thiocyanatum TaxID=47958 RepID=UPI00398C61A3
MNAPLSLPPPTPFASGGGLARFSSRLGRLNHVFLRQHLKGAREYVRIAGYFRSSIFELVDEDIDGIETVRIVCNSDLDPGDIQAAQIARDELLKERWNAAEDGVDSLLRRPRYKRLYELLKARRPDGSPRVEIRVVSRADAPFLHGKAGVIRQTDGQATAFMGSMNETREGWSSNYEIVWEDSSPEGVSWVEREFEHLWSIGKSLPDAIVEEIGRQARKRQVSVGELPEEEVPAAALVEAPIYRTGQELKPWQRAFIAMVLEHRRIYGGARLLLADEVGVGKTLSLAGAALVTALLDDGPVLILCPATLRNQWQVEMVNTLGIPSGVWLSTEKAWQGPDGNIIKAGGVHDITRCPYRIAIVSTGLIVHDAPEAQALLSTRLGMLILDEAHRARRSRGIGDPDGRPTNLLSFMQRMAERSRHVLLGTATPIQTEVSDLWDLLDVLSRGADHVLGQHASWWRRVGDATALIKGEQRVSDEGQGWGLLRNPLPPGQEDALFDYIRSDLDVGGASFFTSRSVTDLSPMTRDLLGERLDEEVAGLSFFQRHNPVARFVVLRRRKTLEDRKLLPCIAVDIWPAEGSLAHMFDGRAVRTTHEFDEAYRTVEVFTTALKQRKKGTGFMRDLLRQRICSSYAAGIATAEKLLAGRSLVEAAEDDDDARVSAQAEADLQAVVAQERTHLQAILDALRARPADPKFDAVRYFLIEKGWLDEGCIIFSQYYDTARWVGEGLSGELPTEPVAIYAGLGRSGLLFGGEWREVERDQIKMAVKEKRIRLVVATDAACEGLNLQTLGTLINIDLPWNPSRLEQRIGRIKRYGQRRDRVDMLNLVYHGTIDEKIYERLSARMRDRYDILGGLPDVLEDDWIDDIESFEARMREFIERRRKANAIDLKWESTVDPDGPGWEACEKVLARSDVIKRMSQGWTERERPAATQSQKF